MGQPQDIPDRLHQQRMVVPNGKREASILAACRSSMPPSPGINVDGVTPHAPLGLPCPLLNMLVPVAIGSNCVAFLDEPFSNILALAGDNSDRTTEFVIVLDFDMHPFAADLPNQGILHPLAVSEPVAVRVFRDLIELGRIQPRKPDILPGNADSIAVGDIGFAGKRVCVMPGMRASPEHVLENKTQSHHTDEEENHKLHRLHIHRSSDAVPLRETQSVGKRCHVAEGAGRQ